MECQHCVFDPLVKALSELTKSFPVTCNGKNIQLNAADYIAYRTRKTNKRVSKAADRLRESYAKLVAFIGKEILPRCQEVCLVCSRASNDDNLSHGGQTMISLDAMRGGVAGDLAGDGARPYEKSETDENESPEDRAFFEDDAPETRQPGGNWVNEHAIRNDQGPADGVTKLPVSVENELKALCASFRSLTVLQQCILLLRWNEMSFVDIGAMNWVPDEFKRHNDKQLVGFWWKGILKKCPWAETIAGKNGKRTKDRTGDNDVYATHSPDTAFVEQELDFGSDL